MDTTLNNISKQKRIRIRPQSKENVVMTITIVVLIGLTIYGFTTFDFGTKPLNQAIPDLFEDFFKMFFEPTTKHYSLATLLKEIVTTLALGLLATIIGALIALFMSLLAAENLSKPWVTFIVKATVAFVRAVPTVLWVLIFAVAAGLGSVAAVIGMTFHTVGYLIKAFSEAFEEIDEGTIEALKAAGANWWQIVSQAVFPSTSTYLLSWTFLRFEINFAVAVAMGAAAGAGGIGYSLFMASSYYFNIRDVGTINYIILVVAIVMEVIATRMKSRIQKGD